MFQNVKRNKQDCVELVENIHQLLYAIVNLHTKSDTLGSLSPAILHHMGNFIEYVLSLNII